MDRITLSAMRFEGIIGIGEVERAFPQMLEIDIEVEADLAAAADSDALTDTVDYVPLVALTERVVEGSSFRLLESLAGALARGALERPNVRAATVRVRKLAVPLDVSMDHAQVEIRRERPSAGR